MFMFMFLCVFTRMRCFVCLFTPRDGASGGGLRPSFQRRHSPRPQPGIWGGKCGVDMLVNSKRFLMLVIKNQVPSTCSENRTRLWAPGQKHSYSFSSALPLSRRRTGHFTAFVTCFIMIYWIYATISIQGNDSFSLLTSADAVRQKSCWNYRQPQPQEASLLIFAPSSGALPYRGQSMLCKFGLCVFVRTCVLGSALLKDGDNEEKE